MENLFNKKMEDKTDDELKAILENREDYQNEAFSAALYEVEKRRKAKIYASPSSPKKESTALEEEQGDENKSFTEILSGLIPGNGYFITPVIIYINILVYLLMVHSGVHPMEPNVDALIDWGGNLRSITLTGEVWRLLSCAFLHIGALHLLFNMYALLLIGKEIETQIGSSKFMFAYLMTAVLASIASIAINDNIVSAGASGAIFGMYGVLITLLLFKGIEIPHKKRGNFVTSVFTFVGYNLFFGFTQEGIDNAAHIGGLVSGLLIGCIFYVTRSDLRFTRIANFVLLVAVTLLTISLPTIIPNQLGAYNQMMEEFAILEEKALNIYHLPDNTSDEVYLKVVTEESVPNLKECMFILNKIDTIGELPLELLKQNELLKRYVNYRIASFQLVEKSITEQTTMYHKDIDTYNEKIELILNKLEGEAIPDSALIVNFPVEPLLKNKDKMDSNQPLYVLNGKPIESIEHIDPQSIEELTVLKEESAIGIYGERGKNGVVLIKTKE